jgi:hypothetical protein
MVDFRNHTAISAPENKPLCLLGVTAIDQNLAKKCAFDVGAYLERIATIW